MQRRPTEPWLHSSTLAQKFPRCCERFVDLAGVFAGALRALWTSAAFAAYNRRDLLDQLVRLELRGEFVRDISDQSDRFIARAGKKYGPLNLDFKASAIAWRSFPSASVTSATIKSFPACDRASSLAI